jgi:hypothetical protein
MTDSNDELAYHRLHFDALAAEHIATEHALWTQQLLTLGPLSRTGKWGPLAPAIRERLEVVERNQERLLGLINQILVQIAVLDRTETTRAVEATESTSAPHARSFWREGDYWTVHHDGRVFRLKGSKGATYLARLLARPHVGLHVFELTSSDSGERRAVSAREVDELGLTLVGTEEGEQLLDERARTAYRARLDDLEEELRDAERMGDHARVARATEEREILSQELATALGFGGRPRRSPTTAERQRINVTRTIRAVIVRITELNPELGRQLALSVRTGTYCSFAPHPGIAAEWDVRL